MQMEFTAVFRPVPEGYVAFVEELPGANTEGATLVLGNFLLKVRAYKAGCTSSQAV